ncbi:MAG: NADH-quinone oxidoreductase subunit K, partial [Thermoplasmata archaeon]
NTIKMVIGTEMLSKSVLLYLIGTGFVQVEMNPANGIGMAEAMVVMIVVIEAVVTAMALSLIVKAHGHTLSVDLSTLRRLWG